MGRVRRAVFGAVRFSGTAIFVAGMNIALGAANGDPTSLVDFRSTTRAAFNGYCLAIVRGIAGIPGPIQLTAQSASLTSTTVIVQSTTGPP